MFTSVSAVVKFQSILSSTGYRYVVMTSAFVSTNVERRC